MGDQSSRGWNRYGWGNDSPITHERCLAGYSWDDLPSRSDALLSTGLPDPPDLWENTMNRRKKIQQLLTAHAKKKSAKLAPTSKERYVSKADRAKAMAGVGEEVRISENS